MVKQTQVTDRPSNAERVPRRLAKKAIAIARVSTDKQAAEDKVSHDDQLDRIREWADREGYEVLDEFREVLSGATELDPERKELRPKFWRAWDLLKAGEIDAVIFWEPSRFCRDKAYSGLKAATYVVDSYRYGDGIRFVINEPDKTNDFAPFILFAQTFGAAQELRTMGRRLEMGQKGALSKGQKGRGRDPFGYRWNAEDKAFAIVPDEAEIIKSIFLRYTGGESLRGVAIALSDKGVQPPDAMRGNKAGSTRWQPTTVSRILARNYYASGAITGEFMGEGYSLSVPPIIEAELFDKVQECVENARHFPRRLMTRGLFQGLIFCGSCGRKYHRGSFGGKQSATYFCPGRLTQTYRTDGTPKCESPILKMRDVDSALWWELVNAWRNPKELARQFVTRVQSEIIILEAGLDSFSDLENLRENRNMAVKLLTRPGMSAVSVQETIEELDNQILICEKRLDGKEREVRRLRDFQQGEKRLRLAINSDQRAILQIQTLLPAGRVVGNRQKLRVFNAGADLSEWLESGRLVQVLFAQDLEVPADFVPPSDYGWPSDSAVGYGTTADRLLDWIGARVTVLVNGQLQLVSDSLYYEVDDYSALSRSAPTPRPGGSSPSRSCRS